MKKRYIFLLLAGFSLVGFAMPNFLLTLLKHNAGTEETAPADGLQERQARFNARNTGAVKLEKTNYLKETKATITRELKEQEPNKRFEVSKIVFTSEETRWIAGQKQVRLSYTYQVQYPNSKPKKLKGSVLLASDEAGNMVNTSQ